MENTEMKPTFTVDDFKKFMETEEGKKVLHPMFDSKLLTLGRLTIQIS